MCEKFGRAFVQVLILGEGGGALEILLLSGPGHLPTPGTTPGKFNTPVVLVSHMAENANKVSI